MSRKLTINVTIHRYGWRGIIRETLFSWSTTLDRVIPEGTEIKVKMPGDLALRLEMPALSLFLNDPKDKQERYIINKNLNYLGSKGHKKALHAFGSAPDWTLVGERYKGGTILCEDDC